MKKNLLTLLFILSQSSSILAQHNNKSEISISLGPAFATGKFAKTDLLDNSSGFAKTGMGISIQYLTPVSKKWKLLIALSGQQNRINTAAFETAFSSGEFYPGIYVSSSINNPPPPSNYIVYPNWHFEKKSWRFGSLQAGLARQFAGAKQSRLSPVLKAAIGLVYASSPLLRGSSLTDATMAIAEQSKETGLGFIGTIGGGIYYSVAPKVALHTSIEFSGTGSIRFKSIESKFTATKGVAGSPGYTISQSMITADGRQNISSVRAALGISFIL